MLDLLCVGHASFDITMSLPTHPKADEKLFADAMQLCGGGPAANAAVCVARLGGKAGFCGYLGNDPFGDLHAEEFTREGVDTRHLIRGDYPSPVSQILAKPDGSRSLVNYKGDTTWLPEESVTISQMPKVMLFDGHEPLISLPLCKQAREAGIPTVLDAGSLHKGTQELAGLVDYLVASEKFARQWSESGDMQHALDELAAVSDNVVITLGENGLIWCSHGEKGAMPAFKVDAIDSTGAGDAFHGAFALGLARNMAWNDLLRFASAAGALTCTKLGARPALPSVPDIQCLLEA